MVEGTVTSLLEDVTKHIRGVAYKNKETGEIKVTDNQILFIQSKFDCLYLDNPSRPDYSS